MNKSWKPLLALALLVVFLLLVWRLLPGPPPSQDGLTNATIQRLEQQVDSLRRLVQGRDSAIAAYQGRIASLDGRLAEIAQRNSALIANLNRQRRAPENVSNDSLARDLNRILRSGPGPGGGPAAGVR